MFGLPDYGISEKINYALTGAIPKNVNKLSGGIVPSDPNVRQYGYSLYDSQQNPLQNVPKSGGSKIPYNSPGGGGSTPSSGGSGGGVTYKSQGASSPDYAKMQADAIAQARKKEMDMIDSEYKAERKRLDKMEKNTTNRYNSAQSQLSSDLENILSQFNQEKGTQMTRLDNTELDRQQQSRSAMDQVRGLLNDLQRKQQAYLSATGNYGSSIAEATGEQFGRQAFSSLGNIQSQRDSAMRDIANKRQQVEDFYAKKITDANSSYQSQSADLKSQFMSQLDAIDQARNVSAQAKKQASLDAWKQYTNAKLNLDAQMASYAQSVNAWRAQQNYALQDASNYDPGAVANIDPTDVYASIGSNFEAINPNAEKARQSGWATSKKTLQDELTKYFPGMDANYFNYYGDQGSYDNSQDGVPDESGNLVDPNTGAILAPAGQW